MQYGYEHGLRYFTPVAIGLAPAIFGSTTHRLRWLPLMIAIVPLAAFGPSLVSRVAAEISTHSAASYSWLTKDPEYLEYNQRVLTGPERQEVQALQEKVPAGEPILDLDHHAFLFRLPPQPHSRHRHRGNRSTMGHAPCGAISDLGLRGFRDGGRGILRENRVECRGGREKGFYANA